MKKLIAALTLLLAFSISANAQDKRAMTADEKGKKEAAELTQYLGLDQTKSEDFTRLFAKKHKTLEQADLSAEKKAQLPRIIEDKIRAGLDAKQMEKLEKNPELFNRLKN